MAVSVAGLAIWQLLLLLAVVLCVVNEVHDATLLAIQELLCRLLRGRRGGVDINGKHEPAINHTHAAVQRSHGRQCRHAL